METNEAHSASTQTAAQTAAHRKRAVVLSWLAVAAMAAAIFFVSGNTGDEVNHGLGIISALKGLLSAAAVGIFGHEVDVSPVGHFTEYLIFGALLYNALRFHVRPRTALVLAFALGSLYGITDEIHQFFVPDRSSDAADWIVDTAASLIGAVILNAWRQTRKARREKNPAAGPSKGL